MTKWAIVLVLGMYIGWNTGQPKIAVWAQDWAASTLKEMLEPQKRGAQS